MYYGTAYIVWVIVVATTNRHKDDPGGHMFSVSNLMKCFIPDSAHHHIINNN